MLFMTECSCFLDLNAIIYYFLFDIDKTFELNFSSSCKMKLAPNTCNNSYDNHNSYLKTTQFQSFILIIITANITGNGYKEKERKEKGLLFNLGFFFKHCTDNSY